MSLERRFAWAAQIKRIASPVAEEVIEIFLRAHSDWMTRYGDRARILGLQDAQHHVAFLAAAVESGSPSAFADYARWTARVLEARAIATNVLGENLAQVKLALHARLPQEVAGAVDEYFTAAFEALAGPPVTQSLPDGAGTASEYLALTRSMYVQAALAGERTAAIAAVTDALRAGVPLLDIYVDVLQEAQYEIGRQWESNHITVAHEHAATAVTQYVATHLHAQLQRTGPSRGTLVMAGVEGEPHTIGALLVGDVLESRGWAVCHLGSDLPHPAILQAVRERSAECLGISVTMPVNVNAVHRLVDGVRREWGRGKRVVLGGSAFRHSPRLPAEIGADGYASDLRHALALLCPDTH